MNIIELTSINQLPTCQLAQFVAGPRDGLIAYMTPRVKFGCDAWIMPFGKSWSGYVRAENRISTKAEVIE